MKQINLSLNGASEFIFSLLCTILTQQVLHVLQPTNPRFSHTGISTDQPPNREKETPDALGNEFTMQISHKAVQKTTTNITLRSKRQ
jgi:hypothetical protein